MEPIQESSSFRRLMARLQARKSWEAAHPELAAAWTDALREDDARQRAAELEAARADVEADAPLRLKRLGVPARAVEALKAPTGTPALSQARHWLDVTAKPFLVLMGGPGTGKTVAAAWTVKRRLAEEAGHGRPTGPAREVCMWVASAELATASTFTDADKEWLERACRVSLLVLDDFAAELLTESAQARLERLVDVRYGNNLRTVLTTNADTANFKKRAGSRILDRFAQAAYLANCGDESLRRRPT